MRRRLLNLDLDSGDRWFEWEEDDDPARLPSVPPRPSGAAQQPAPAVPARLLSDREAAEYLKVSRSMLRALVANGVIKRVQLPSTDGRGRTARVLRIDRRDLDGLIERSKG